MKGRKDIPGCCGVKHVPHLRRLGFLLRFFPPLTQWAKLCRAYGAGLVWGVGIGAFGI